MLEFIEADANVSSNHHAQPATTAVVSIPKPSAIRNANVGPSSGDGWHELDRLFQEVDKNKIGDYKEDIDTLLVFAGLFSGVLTAFNIEAYPSLQVNPQDVSTCLLAQISGQLSSFSVNSGFVNATIPSSTAACSPSFQASRSAVTINFAWFLSLVLSLITASFAMLVKQWLRAYLSMEAISPQERCRVRTHRNWGMTKWRVFAIASMLPLILQIALGLFFLGLAEFLWQLHPILGRTIEAVIIIWLILYVSTAFTPLLPLNCPYETSLTEVLKSLMWKVVEFPAIVRFLFVALWSRVSRNYAESIWVSPSVPASRSEFARDDDTMDSKVLLEADQLFMDDEYLEKVLFPSLEDISPEDTFTCLKQIAAHRDPQKRGINSRGYVYPLVFSLRGRWVMTQIFGRILERIFRQQEGDLMSFKWMDWMTAVLCSYLRFLSQSAPGVKPGVAGCIFQSLAICDQHVSMTIFKYIPYPLSEHIGAGELQIASDKAFENIVSGTYVDHGSTNDNLNTLSTFFDLMLYVTDCRLPEQQEAFRGVQSSACSRLADALVGDISDHRASATRALESLNRLKRKVPAFEVDSALLVMLETLSNRPSTPVVPIAESPPRTLDNTEEKSITSPTVEKLSRE